MFEMSRTAPSAPPGVFNSTTSASAPARSASFSRRSKLDAVTELICPSIVITATFRACRAAGTACDPLAPEDPGCSFGPAAASSASDARLVARATHHRHPPRDDDSNRIDCLSLPTTSEV